MDFTKPTMADTNELLHSVAHRLRVTFYKRPIYGALGIPEVILLFHTSWSPTYKTQCIIHVCSHTVSYE